MHTSGDVKRALDRLENPDDSVFLQRFFKTGKGEYGEGDIFIGLRVPQTRKIAAEFKDLSLSEIENLLESPVHEHRLAALVIMTEQAKRATEPHKKALYDLYLRRTDRINNWDLVDVSCRDVVGGYLIDKSHEPLYKLAISKNIWERRIAMVSTWYFIRSGQLDDTFKLAELLVSDSHDLIHKAAGWMLREAGKKDEAALRAYLEVWAPHMPRTMLRYAIEKLSPELRAYYMYLK